MSSPGKESLRILCIHGYRQNADAFKGKIGSFRKIFKNKNVEFVFLNAPHQVPPDPDLETEEGADQRGWWFCTEDKKFSGKMFCESSFGLQESITLVEEAFRTQGPFDGILGFSQGASLTALLSAHSQMNPDSPIKFRFAILVAGFKSRCSEHSKYFEQKIQIPTLQVMGETDNVIPKEMSEELSECFENATVTTHPGGHYVPASGQLKSSYLNIVKQFECPE
ncbi:esterase OVCA2 [Neocloeon triangulifer]|uniref:esterase OVCA2 n=1 Tax=Neocloeon triangulifer TaxID=2078957 RepID=UPI00286F2ABB|nr:esterase OVCA2 [Neocloeon triangulifer]XP_059470154.1 esterase OVCA2 [Neocloeon triangulifer]